MNDQFLKVERGSLKQVEVSFLSAIFENQWILHINIGE